MILDPLLDLFRGKAVTIPAMDGALRPNTILEDAESLHDCAAPDNLVTDGKRILFSSGNAILKLPGGEVVHEFSAPVTAAAMSPDGTLAAGLENGTIEFLSAEKSRLSPLSFTCPTALAFGPSGELYVCNGSDRFAPGEWASDLMSKKATGSVWKVTPDGDRQCLARGLAYPFGIAVDSGNGRLIVAEAWRHRLVGIPLKGGEVRSLLANLPGYPARISNTSTGYLLSVFAPRNRLIEFVLLEDAYRGDMMRSFDSRYWIAPSLSASRSFMEPLQCGGVKTMGIHKPWSPSRSYGLVVEINREIRPVASYHSRANGTRHGITSAIEHAGDIIAASKGGDAILRFERGRS
jgi:hypothetical protein